MVCADKKSPEQPWLFRGFGVPDTIRTCDLQSRSLTLYPAELQAQNFAAGSIIAQIYP